MAWHRARRYNASNGFAVADDVLSIDVSAAGGGAAAKDIAQTFTVLKALTKALSKGGEHSEENIRVACQPCNDRKLDRLPTPELIPYRLVPALPDASPLIPSIHHARRATIVNRLVRLA